MNYNILSHFPAAIVALLILQLICVSACQPVSEEPRFTINGQMDGLDSCTAYITIRLPDNTGEDTIAVTPVRDGRFAFTGRVEYPVPAKLFFDCQQTNGLPIILENDSYRIRGEFAKTFTYHILGGEWHEKAINQFLFDPDYLFNANIAIGYRTDREVVKDMVMEIPEDMPVRIQLAKRYWHSWVKALKVKDQRVNESVATSEDPLYQAIQLASYNYHKLPCFDSVMVNRITDHFGPDHYYSQLITTRYREKVEIMEMEERLKVGNKAIDVALHMADSASAGILDLVKKNKYTLLEFWASWCGPCRAEIPHMKRAYNDYREKGFEIVSISIDSKKENWEKASASEQIPWVNTLDREQTAENAYNITGIPYNLLLDDQGIIIDKNLRGERLDNKLHELLN